MGILLQVMDHATLTDNTGRKADFRQVMLIMTSNAGSREMSQATIGFAGGTTSRTRRARGKQALERFFTPEFRNRLDGIVTFRPLTPEVMETIVDKFVRSSSRSCGSGRSRSTSGPRPGRTSRRRASTPSTARARSAGSSRRTSATR